MGRVVGGKSAISYEKVAVDEWLEGTIEEVQYDEARAYKSKNKETEEWEEKTAPHVRLKFKIDGYQWPHYSRWMKCSTHQKNNFYSKYLKYLTPQYDCQDKAIDLDLLVGIQVRTMWENDGDYQHITQIRGMDPTLNVIASGTEIAPGLVDPQDETRPPSDAEEGDVPF